MLSLLKLCSLPCMHLIQPQHLPSSELDLERSRLVKTPWRLLSPLFHLLDELLPNCGPRIRPTYECHVFHSRNYCYYSYIGTSLRMTWKAIELFFLSLFVNCILQIKCSVSRCKGYRRACVLKEQFATNSKSCFLLNIIKVDRTWFVVPEAPYEWLLTQRQFPLPEIMTRFL